MTYGVKYFLEKVKVDSLRCMLRCEESILVDDVLYYILDVLL